MSVAGAIATAAVFVWIGMLPLTRRSDLILAGAGAPRSRSRCGYLALEIARLAALATAGAFPARISRPVSAGPGATLRASPGPGGCPA